MLEDENFSFDMSDFEEDLSLSITDLAKQKAVDMILDSATKAKESLKFKEATEVEHQIRLLSFHVSALISISELDESLSDEELEEKIEEIFKATTELTFENMNSVLSSDENFNVEPSTAPATSTDSGEDDF